MDPVESIGMGRGDMMVLGEIFSPYVPRRFICEKKITLTGKYCDEISS
jgi:hypothetical protein